MKKSYKRLSDFLENNHILNDTQHGFRSGRSTLSAAVNFIESVIDSIDKGEEVIGIFMDLTKAFESVDHQLLLNKLFGFGVKEVS